jgi:hypothetical protein
MAGINLFEQHALAMRAATPSVALDTPLAAARQFIAGATISQCAKLAAHLSARLFMLEKMHGGLKAANLNEAARFVADAMLDINGALDAEDEVPCRCGRCDDCVAARSDERHDRKRDRLRG